MTFNDARKAGTALFLGVIQFGIFEMVSEFIYPSYSVSGNWISDLGATCGAGASCPSQNSWMLFDTSVVIMGIAVLVSGLFIYRYYKWKPISGLMFLTGIGAIGLGVFNETAPYGLHHIFSLITFLAIGLAAILSYRLQRPPLSYFGIVLGIITLVSLILYLPDSGVTYGGMLGIGPGGLERMIVYPVLFWTIAFGGHLMAMEEPR